MKEITIKVPDNCELKQDGNTYTIIEKEKKPAWSEEDDYILNLVSKFTSKGYKSHPKIPSLEFVQDWLKSLKERYSWKPSDEQIKALLKLEEMHVLEHEKNQENAHLYMVIKSLKEQLLKLKEE